MNVPLEVQFARAMGELESSGVDFGRIARETLREVFGDSPFEVLLSRSGSAKQSPSEFIGSLVTIFPASIIGTLMALIARRAMASLPSPRKTSQYHEYELLINKLQELPRGESKSTEEHLLHDHREEDELDRMVGHKTD